LAFPCPLSFCFCFFVSLFLSFFVSSFLSKGDNNTLVNSALGSPTACLDVENWNVSTSGALIDSHHCCCEDLHICPGKCGQRSKNYNQQWTWNETTHNIQVMDEHRTPGLCLEASEAKAGATLQLAECNPARNTEQEFFLNAKNKPFIRLLSHDDDGEEWCLSTSAPGAPTPAPGPIRKFPCEGASTTDFPWCDTTKPNYERAAALVKAMTTEQKIPQMSTFSFTKEHGRGINPAIDSLRLPQYNYHSEGLHGVRGDCDKPATLWPQVIGMAATGNLSLVHEMGMHMGLGFRAGNNVLRESRGKMPFLAVVFPSTARQ
jgi:hypothetical protein